MGSKDKHRVTVRVVLDISVDLIKPPADRQAVKRGIKEQVRANSRALASLLQRDSPDFMQVVVIDPAASEETAP